MTVVISRNVTSLQPLLAFDFSHFRTEKAYHLFLKMLNVTTAKVPMSFTAAP